MKRYILSFLFAMLLMYQPATDIAGQADSQKTKAAPPKIDKLIEGQERKETMLFNQLEKNHDTIAVVLDQVNAKVSHPKKRLFRPKVKTVFIRDTVYVHDTANAPPVVVPIIQKPLIVQAVATPAPELRQTFIQKLFKKHKRKNHDTSH